MSQGNAKLGFSTFLLYGLSFFLLWEWLRPVEVLTDTGYFGAFLGFTIIALLLAFINIPFIIRFFIKGFYILFFIHSIYYEGSLFQPVWLTTFFKELVTNFSLVWKGQFLELTDAYRTLLFFILLWLMVYLIRYWLIKRKKMLIFFFMTIVFITVLDTFTPYEANGAIVRSVIVGFLVMGILTLHRLIEKEMLHKTVLLTRKWLIPLSIMVAGSVMIGYAVPKAGPIWPDPVPYIQSYNSESGLREGGISRRAGYGTDDSNLGGPFLGDETVVFRAEVDERHYWKVETKDMYTGKGWVVSNNNLTVDFSGEPVSMLSFAETVPYEERASIVYNELEYPHIQYPHGLIEIKTEDPFWYRMDVLTQKIIPLQNLEPNTPESYTVHYQKPSFQVEALKNSSAARNDREYETIKNIYTQLPANLPARIRELALEITMDAETVFDKVQAIERYFQANSYVYDQQNVAVPEAGQDYVEQFLFETKRGYCDNFSTSMAVLLRTLDIPSRWVKGYTSGEYIRTLESGKRVYEVTNNNAHSWVEVYFPEIGWVPFEPTRGFSNNVAFQLNTSSEVTTNTDDREAIAHTRENRQMEDSDAESSSSSIANYFSLQNSHYNLFLKWGFTLFVLVLIPFLFRKKWLPIYTIYLFKFRKKDEIFPRAFMLLLKQLDRFGLGRKQGQTLREYAKYIDSIFKGKEMQRLTEQYERYFYRATLKEGVWLEAKEDWETLLRKTRA
ncbi:transglutaminase domain-containing protein [Bacillus sp. B15-48]|uniref:transglutaminase domain-containing protein n=1 Tax=Bacillus sp. B15-48 TaxID=1548601 RepID=UPI001EF2B9A7|nr:transglutaminase domain-containing protein [Bacillus sp. B15-48]